jgi:hypothetical protein
MAGSCVFHACTPVLSPSDLRYRCAINNFLRPGDTALINGGSMIVNNITYTIGVSSEVMEIAEA